MDRPFVTQVDVFSDDESLRILIGQYCPSRGSRLSHNVHRPWFVQEAIMDATGIPGIDALRATERGVTNKGVAPAVVVTSVIMGAVMILLS